MRTRLPPNVTIERNRHGRRVTYYREGKGPRTRLPDFGTPDFDAAYKAALAGKTPPKPALSRAAAQGSVTWAIEEYRKTLHFRGLDPITQRRRESFFAQMRATIGNAAIGRVTEQDLINSREKRTGGKGHAANNFLKAIKPLFAYAKTRGWIAVDPARNVDFVKPLKGSRPAWTIADYQAFEARHPLGTMPNLALRILLFAGLRRGDAAILGEQHIKDGMVHFRPSKTSKTSDVVVNFTVLPPLKEAIDATAHLRKGKTAMAFLLTEAGTPFKSSASFGNWFEDRCIEAKVVGRAHGLRKLGPALAAEWGATELELMAMWGWTTMAQATLYTRSADRKRMGVTAASKLLEGFTAAQTANNIPRTSDEGAGIAEKGQ